MSKFCTHCGCELPDEALNCSNCGTPVDAAANQGAPTGPVTPPPYYQQPQQPLVPCPTTKEFLKYIAFPALLSLVTCGIGGLILMIVWSCDNTNPVRRNYMRAYLIYTAIAVGILIIFYIVLFAIMLITGSNFLDSNPYGWY